MKITIDGQEIEVRSGETVLGVAKRKGFNVPSLCDHSDLKIKASCRVCVIEVDNNIVPSCSTKVTDGMTVVTDSPKLRKLRKINLELIFSQHQEECNDCVFNMKCKMLDLAKEYKIKINRFEDRKTNFPNYHFGASLEFDSSKCIDCRNCVEMCSKQGVDFLEIKGRGHLMEVVPSEREDKDCVYCGQCITHCPAGAFEAVGEFENIADPFKDKSKKIIVQIAPAVRASIGEEFGLDAGDNYMGKLVALLGKMGADKVFDVSVGADFTTIEESEELLERLEKGNLPMFTSCCPAWVKFVEFYYPEFIPNLTTVRSPHLILGGLIKTWYAEREGIRPEEIFLVSLMPCVAKKYEITRDEVKIENIKPVDYVMTTREIGRLARNEKIDFASIEDLKCNDFFGAPTKSGVDYGMAGGVMRSAILNITGGVPEFFDTEKNMKEAEIEYQGRKIKLAVVHGLGNAKKLLEEIKQGTRKYDYVEVMACEGGCVGGGGQPVPSEKATRRRRADALFKASREESLQRAGENPQVKAVYENYLSGKDRRMKICYTEFNKRNKSFINKE